MVTCYLEIQARRKTEHGLDVPAVVPVPVHPHDGDELKHGDNNDRHPGAVGVHQVERKLAVLGEAGQPKEEAGGNVWVMFLVLGDNFGGKENLETDV